MKLLQLFVDFLLHIILLCFTYSVLGQNETNTEVQPAVSSGESVIHDRLENMRRRSRHNRINNIRQHVLHTLGFSSPPQIDEEMKEEILRNLSITGVPYKAVSERCYSASCLLPNWIDEDLWNDEDSKTLRLFFDILVPEDSATTILNATLKLHIKERTEICRGLWKEGVRIIQVYQEKACRCFTEEDEGYGDDSVRFTVVVSQFLKPLKRRNRVPKMRILDVQMVVVRKDQWVSFNVAEAIEDWSERRKRRHGLEVNVIDSQGFPVDAKALFGNVDCAMLADIECQDTSLPIETQKNLNFSTSPMLEVFTETRTRIEFREKRESLTIENQIQNEESASQGKFPSRLQNVLKCGKYPCDDASGEFVIQN